MKIFLLRFFFLSSFVLFLFTSVLPQDVWASSICRYDARGDKAPDMVDCLTVADPVCGDSTTVVSDAFGLRLNSGSGVTPIDMHGLCRYLDNGGSEGYFVPLRSHEEWLAFLNHAPSVVAVTHCARPFNGQNVASGLYFGETTAQFAMGDTGDPVRADVFLPYYRTGGTWPGSASCSKTTHQFNNTCYEEFVQPKCWKWVSKTCTGTTCTGKPPKQVCTNYTYDCSYCGDSGSVCEKNYYSWSETFNFVATALDSDTKNPGWSGQSTRIAGTTRPSQCNTRCTFNGHDCTCPSPPPLTCVPNGTTTCKAGRKYDSCGTDIGSCPTCCIYWGCP